MSAQRLSLTQKALLVPVNATGAEPAKDSGYIPTLDGWRALAVLAVVVCHGAAFPFAPEGLWPSERLYHWTRHGAYGVDLFFAISGFLIGGKLLAEQAASGTLAFGRFYARRLFRIAPNYWVYLGVLVALSGLGLPLIKWQEALSCLLYTRNYLPANPRYEAGYTGHLWSLAVEEHFYLVMPPLLHLLKGRRAHLVFAALAALVAVWRFIEFRHNYLGQWLAGASFFERSDVRCDGLFYGVAMAAACREAGLRAILAKLTQPRLAWLWFAAFVATVQFEPPLKHVWVGLLAPLLLASTVLHAKTFLALILETRLLRYIGQRSYSIYVWQSLFLVGAEAARSLPLGVAQALPVNLVLIWLCSEASYRLIEKPMLRLGHKLTKTWFDPPPITAPQDLGKVDEAA